MIVTRSWWFLPLLISCALAACDAGDAGDARSADAPDDTGKDEAGQGDAGKADRGHTAPAAPRAVTLVTGDRVLMLGNRHAIRPGPGRAGMRFRTFSQRGHYHVVPEDAAELLAAGRIDRRLFDVDELIRLGYDDTSRADVPLIVTYRADRRRTAAPSLAAAGAQLGRAFASIDGQAVRAPKGRAAAVWTALAKAPAAADAIDRLWLDGKREPLLDVSAPQIGAPAAWDAGLTGTGVMVAVLDSGIDVDHPDFAGRIAASMSFVESSPDAVDDVGHGTHVASILAGSGAASDGRYRGIAPDAQLAIGKVCDLAGCPDSSLLAGMEWAAASGARVVNISLGSDDTDEVDPLEEAIDTLSAQHGTLFVVAAGNLPCGGPAFLQVSSPSTADAALSVGSVDPFDQVSFFSCRGPRRGDAAVKPDLTAPGEDIVAARAAGTPDGDVDPVDDFYARLIGTSMATPHVAGAAAILAQQHPDWQGDEIKAALMASATPSPDADVFTQGAGRVDVARAIEQTAFSVPASLSLGSPRWPHGDDEPIVRTVSYRNDGPAPITLELAVELTDASGAPAPAGTIAVAPESVTVPPGGEAQATVTADTSGPGPDGLYSGALVGTAGGVSVRTPIGLDKEVESYDVQVNFRYRDPSSGGTLFTIIDLEAADFYDLTAAVESLNVRLPRGRYYIDAGMFDDRTSAEVVKPELEVTEDINLTLDAREAQPISITIPHDSARPAMMVINTELRLDGGGVGIGFGSFPPSEDQTFYSLDLGPPLSTGDSVTTIVSTWAEPGDPEAPFVDSPYAFHLSFIAAQGTFFSGFVRDVGREELAEVRSDYAAEAPGLSAELVVAGWPVEAALFFPIAGLLSFHLPATRTDHFLAEEVAWDADLVELSANGSWATYLQTLGQDIYQRGSRHRARWNQAVLGPSLGFPAAPAPWVVRFGDDIFVDGPALYADRADHHGWSLIETGHQRLFRGGELIGESNSPSFGFFTVPPQAGDYRLEVQSVRGGSSQLSTQVDIAWSFRSRRVDGAALPVMAVRFVPKLDELNRAPAGRLYSIPVALSRQPGGDTAPLSSLTVDASYDGGESWQPASVLRFGDFALAVIEHPAVEGTVSLRATAVDQNENAVEQTIRDAYRLRAE
jgi:subtilisin family serine protease